MLRAGARICRGLRWGIYGLAVMTVVTAVSSDADARTRRKPRAAAASSYQPPTASIVVDANTGKVMQATHADSQRHPASLTKIMTLYMLFERLEAGKLKLNSELPVSSHAAAQAPSKLGLKPGETIKVETAIRAIVTKSANDVAVIVSEAVGGDEPNFARLMTAKAHALGMKHTTYRNASGLPDDKQITTARDQAILGRAIRDRFPNYYHYFATRTFEFRGKAMRNHNHLLGRVAGVDGIKTGYIRASGFNIVTSVRRNNRYIVAVVFGGRSGEARDARARSLIDNNINIASAKRTAPPMVEGWDTAEAGAKSANGKAKESAAVPLPVAAPDLPVAGSTDPIKPIAIKTVAVQAGAMRAASLSPLPSDSRKLTPAPATANPASVTNIATVKNESPQIPTISVKVSSKDGVKTGAKEGTLGVLRVKGAQLASAGDNVPVTASTEPAAKPHAGGWMIQVGAFPDEKDAQQRLNTAQSKAKDQLGQADPFTERTVKGDKPLFRARFAGLEKDQAENACKQLKRNEIPCMLLKN